MKRNVLIGIMVLISSVIKAQVVKKNTSGIAFKVDDVELAEDTLRMENKRSVIENQIGYEIESFSIFNREQRLVSTKMHAVVEALHYSYAQHRPIEISPDIVWLMICQAVAQHVNLHAEELRSILVQHEGKDTIRIRRDDFVKASVDNRWHEVFPAFADSIKTRVNPDFFNLFDTEFSTTGQSEKIAFQITMMSTVSNYFDYWTNTECGIPFVKLTGKVKDWKLIRREVKKLEHYGLGDWIKELIPILDQFVLAAKGKVDKEFWQSIYKIKEDCVDIFVTGWIMKFFPYRFNEERKLVQNRNIHKRDLECDVRFNQIPSGISKVSFKWLYFHDVFDMEFCAGFIGIHQDPQSKILKPEIHWLVKEKNAKRKSISPLVAENYEDEVIEVDTIVTELDGVLDTVISETIEYDAEREMYQQRNMTAIEKVQLDPDCVFEFQEPFIIVEQMPLFDPEHCSTQEESSRAIMKYCWKQLRKVKIKEQYNGRILVRFVVSKWGTVEMASIVKSDIPELNDIVIDLVKKMPKWQPGRQRGKNVPVLYTLPISINFY